jgi:hypothetical protein
MKVFDKPVSEYVLFQKSIILLILVVGFGRLSLSLAGLPTSWVRWISLTAVAFVGIAYCGIKVPRTGFGEYRHLLPLYFVQAVLGNLIIVGGIALAIVSGRDNIFSMPEYGAGMAGRTWMHAGAHLLDGFVIGPIAGWLIGSIIMFVVRKAFPVKSSPESGQFSQHAGGVEEVSRW